MRALPDARVFLDVDSIDSGMRWRDAIRNRVHSCDVMLVIIGDEWLVRRDKVRELEHAADPVRFEIGEAPAREGVIVLPVLVEGAPMPADAELPEDVRALREFNARPVHDRTYDRDLTGLVERLAALEQVKPRAAPKPARTGIPSRATARFLEEEVPAMGREQLVDLIAELRRRGWGDADIHDALSHSPLSPPDRLPSRITPAWLADNVPLLSQDRVRSLVDELRRRRWSDEEIRLHVVGNHPQAAVTEIPSRIHPRWLERNAPLMTPEFQARLAGVSPSAAGRPRRSGVTCPTQEGRPATRTGRHRPSGDRASDDRSRDRRRVATPAPAAPSDRVAGTAMTTRASRTVLAVSPHPDDELLGAGGTLIELVDAGWAVVNLACGLGRPDDHDRRRAEVTESCRRVGFALEIVDPPVAMSRGDALAAAEERVAEAVAEAARRRRPDLIFAPSPRDAHHAHQTVGRATVRAIEQAGASQRLAFWGLWASLPVTTTVVAIERAVLERVLHGLRAHAGELARARYDDVVIARARTAAVLEPERALGFGSRHAEIVLAEALWELRHDATTGRWSQALPRAVRGAEVAAAPPGWRPATPPR